MSGPTLAGRPPTDLAWALRAAAVRAALAPSAFGLEPWHIIVRPDSMTIRPDWERRSRALDPDGRQVILSCASASATALVALAGAGVAAVADHRLGRRDPDLRIRICPDPDRRPDPRLARLDPGSGRFRPHEVPAAGAEVLRRSAGAVAELVAELGVEIVVAAQDHARSPHPLLAVCTPDDRLDDWVDSGSVWGLLTLALGRHGWRGDPLALPIEDPPARARLTADLGHEAFAQVLLRVGQVTTPSPRRRRRLVDVLSFED